MKKRKLIIICSIVVAIISVTTIFAAYTFNKIINSETASGKIQIVGKKFLNYQVEVNSDDYQDDPAGYLNALKQRRETPEELSFDTIKCYANERKNLYADDLGYQYLNQLGFKFSFKSTIDTYLKIEFNDSWATKKVYYSTGSIQETYILKDKNESNQSPFSISSDEWIYDVSTNSAYYKYIIPATCDDINSETAEEKAFTFDIDSSYFYNLITNPSYREMIIVDVSYSVSIVQANRAEEKWEVDFDKLGIINSYKQE